MEKTLFFFPAIQFRLLFFTAALSTAAPPVIDHAAGGSGQDDAEWYSGEGDLLRHGGENICGDNINCGDNNSTSSTSSTKNETPSGMNLRRQQQQQKHHSLQQRISIKPPQQKVFIRRSKKQSKTLCVCLHFHHPHRLMIW